MKEQRVVLITGATSGLGRATAALLQSRGYRVFGTSRRPAKDPGAGYTMLQLDVRSDASAATCVNEVIQRAGRLDVLINNAGYELAGAIEETSLPEAQAQFETNFFGVARMVKSVLPVMRRQRNGQIINIGSLAGLIGVPFHGYYSATKHALEGYTESLRYEVQKFNIGVSIVEPGFMKTALGTSSLISGESIPDYARMREQAFRYFSTSLADGDDPAHTAEIILSIVVSDSPGMRYKVGKLVNRLPWMKAILPWSMFEAGTRRNFKLDS